jgi:DNA (cytosine-5)-methyltransferase 1
VDLPLHTVTASKKDQNVVVAATLVKNNFGSVPAQDIGGPLHTVTTQGNRFALVAAHLVHIGNGERQGQAPRAMDAAKPLGTVVAGGIKHSVVEAFLQKFADNGKAYAATEPLHTVMAGAPRHAVISAHLEQANGSPDGEKPLAGRSAEDPLSTIVAKGCTQRLVTSNLVKLRGTCAHGQPVDEPLATVSAQGTHLAEVRAFLLKYYGNESEGHDPEGPLGTVTTKDRFGLVTVSIGGEEYVIVDIGMRMLTPRELFNAQGFPPDYVIDHDAEGRPTTKTSQVARCGNSVCPPLARALTAANAPSLMLTRMAEPEEPAEAVA